MFVCSGRASTITHIYPPVLQGVPGRGRAGSLERVILGVSGVGMQDLGYELPRIPILSNSVNSAAWCQLGDTFSTALSPCLWTAFHSPSSRRKIRVARIISSVGSGRPLNLPRQRSMKTP